MLVSSALKMTFRPDERFLMERYITAGVEFQGFETTPKHKSSVSYPPPRFQRITKAKCRAADFHQFNFELSMLSIDLECSIKGQLYSIGLYSDDIEQVIMVGHPEPDSPDYILWVEDEKALLTAFIESVHQCDPDIFIGWNVVNFDFDLLQKRCDLHQIVFCDWPRSECGRIGAVIAPIQVALIQMVKDISTSLVEWYSMALI